MDGWMEGDDCELQTGALVGGRCRSDDDDEAKCNFFFIESDESYFDEFESGARGRGACALLD